MVITGVNNNIVSLAIDVADLKAMAVICHKFKPETSEQDIVAAHFRLTVDRLNAELEAFKKKHTADVAFENLDEATATKN